MTEGVDYVSSILSSEPPVKRLNSRETIAEILVADLGELPSVSPYLIVCLISTFWKYWVPSNICIDTDGYR